MRREELPYPVVPVVWASVMVHDGDNDNAVILEDVKDGVGEAPEDFLPNLATHDRACLGIGRDKGDGPPHFPGEVSRDGVRSIAVMPHSFEQVRSGCCQELRLVHRSRSSASRST